MGPLTALCMRLSYTCLQACRPPILHVRLAPETLRKLDAVAGGARPTRSFIANAGLGAWIGREIELIEELQVALEEGRAGKGVPHDKAMRMIDMAVERAAKRNGRRKVVRK